MLPAESSTRNHVAASSLSPQVARKGSTLSGFVQRSRLEREVGRDLHSNKWEEVWSCIRQSGQSGEGCRGSPMEKRYETRSGDLFVWLEFVTITINFLDIYVSFSPPKTTLKALQETTAKLRWGTWSILKHAKNILKHAKNILKHAKNILKHAKNILKHAKNILKHAKDILKHAKNILKHAKNILKHAKNILKHAIDIPDVLIVRLSNHKERSKDNIKGFQVVVQFYIPDHAIKTAFWFGIAVAAVLCINIDMVSSDMYEYCYQHAWTLLPLTKSPEYFYFIIKLIIWKIDIFDIEYINYWHYIYYCHYKTIVRNLGNADLKLVVLWQDALLEKWPYFLILRVM